MVFAKWERPIVDGSGNIIANATVEVRRMAPGFPLAVPLYADRDGNVAKDNPFTLDPGDNGRAKFYAAGGRHRIRIYAPGGYDVTYDDEAIGTAQATDANVYQEAGFTYAPEDQTSAPPSTGCIRANDADWSLATHLYLHGVTVSGTDLTSYLLALAPGAKSIKNRLLLSLSNGTEIAWLVDAVADAGDYLDITVNAASYVGPAGPLAVAPSGFITVSSEISGGDGTMASIVGDGSLEVDPTDPAHPVIALDGDEDTPGANKVYGTDGAGNKGWKNDPAGGATAWPSGRLSLTSGTAITTTDVAGATTIYYVPLCGETVPVYDGSGFIGRSIGSQLSLALNSNSGHTGYHQSGRNFDLFAIYDGGALKLGTGPSWNAGAVAGSDTARGTGAGSTELELKNGIWTNKNAITIRVGSSSGDTVSVAANQATYLGSFRATANGQATDSKLKRFLYNAYNQVRRFLLATDATPTWTYSVATVRQARGSTANQVEMLFGLAGGELDVTVMAQVANSTSTGRFVALGIGIDSTTINAADIFANPQIVNLVQELITRYCGYPGLGYHYAAWLEMGGGADTQTWAGAGAGLQGSIFA